MTDAQRLACVEAWCARLGITTHRARIAALCKQLGADASVDADGWLVLSGPTWIRRYHRPEDVVMFAAPAEHGPGRYDYLTTPDEKARARDITFDRRMRARAAEAR